MSHRSVIETLDLHNDYGEIHSDQWLSPRISFSTDFFSGSSDKLSPEKKLKAEGEESPNGSVGYSTEFEFSMSSLDLAGPGTPGFVVPADQLFHKGRLLPGYHPPDSSVKDLNEEFNATSELPDSAQGSPPATISRHITAESAAGPASLGCVLGPSCLRAPKGPKWRELFGALRRVKSDSGRQRIPDESLLPRKSHDRKKFFGQIFGNGEARDSKGSSTPDGASTPTYSSSAPLSQEKKALDSALTRISHHRTTSASVAVDCRGKGSAVYAPQRPKGEVLGGFQDKNSDRSSDNFVFTSTPSRGGKSGNSGTSSGRVSPNNSSGKVSPNRASGRGGNLGRSPSGRVIVRGLDRIPSGRNSASYQEQIRALRSREIRRSPDRSSYSNVRIVTPLLNVPVCMGPVLRGATKAGKGRLSNFRSFLTFKSKMTTSMSTSPIATR